MTVFKFNKFLVYNKSVEISREVNTRKTTQLK